MPFKGTSSQITGNKRHQSDRFVPPTSKYTERGRMFLLLGKRNQQFHEVFERVRDVRTVMNLYLDLHKVFVNHFGYTYKTQIPEWFEVLIWANERNFFFSSDMIKWYPKDKQMSFVRLDELTKRGYLKKDSSQPIRYHVSADGKIFLRELQTKIASVMANAMKAPIKKRKKK